MTSKGVSGDDKKKLEKIWGAIFTQPNFDISDNLETIDMIVFKWKIDYFILQITKNPNCPTELLNKIYKSSDNNEIIANIRNHPNIEVINVKVSPKNKKSIIRDITYTNLDTDEYAEAREIYRWGHFILEMIEIDIEKIDLDNPIEFEVNNYNIIDWSLDDGGVVEDPEWDEDERD